MRLYLAKTVSLTNFMIRKYGKQRFAEFLEKIRKGTELEAALKTLCGKKTTIQDLEKVWLDHVKEAKKRDFTPG